MADSAWFVLAIILVALAFDFVNGFHDAANSIATVVSTRVLSPSAAVVWAATFNFIAVFVFGTAVAKTMGKGLVDLAIVDATVILAGLVGAIVWDPITWWLWLPTSSSHALFGGRLIFGPRVQRRTENDGDHRRVAGRRAEGPRRLSGVGGASHGRGRSANVGHHRLRRGHGARDHVGRVAHRENHGPAPHQAHAVRRLLRRNERRDHAV